jgi:hypothetical protein
MGTIPAPNIPQDIAVASQQNSAAEYARVAALKQQTAQSQQQTQQAAAMGPGQLQMQQEQVRAAQMQNAQVDAMNRAYQGAFKPDANGNMALDTDALQQSLAQNHAGSAIPQIMKGITDYQTAVATHQEQMQKIQTGARDTLGNLGYTIQQAKYDPQLVHTLLADELNDPSLPPQQKQQIAQMQQQIAQNPALIQQMADQWVSQSPAQQAKEIQRQEAAAKATTAGAEQQKANAADWKDFPALGVSMNTRTGEQRSVSGGAVMTDQMMDSKAQNLMQKQKANQPLDPSDTAWLQAYRERKTLVPQFTINANTTGAGMIPNAAGTGGAGAAPPTADSIPNSIKGTVQQILDYRAQLPPAGRNNPTNTAIRYWVNALDPQHDYTTFPARNKLMTSFTSGPESHQINAVNTALGHVGVMSDAIDALNNTNIPALNAIANKLGVAVGNTPATTLQTIVHRVGPELAAAYIQGGGGEGERGTTADDFSVNKGTAQLKANAAITAQLLRSKIGSLQNQYEQTMGRQDFQQRFITPEAQRTLTQLSPQGGANQTGGGGMVTMKAPNGATKQVPSDQVDHYKSLGATLVTQ